MTPALLTRMCSGPSHASTNASTDARSARSSGATRRACCRWSRRCPAAVRPPASSSRTASVTSAPAPASARAVSIADAGRAAGDDRALAGEVDSRDDVGRGRRGVEGRADSRHDLHANRSGFRLPTGTRSGYCLPAVVTATMRHGFLAHDDRAAGRARASSCSASASGSPSATSGACATYPKLVLVALGCQVVLLPALCFLLVVAVRPAARAGGRHDAARGVARRHDGQPVQPPVRRARGGERDADRGQLGARRRSRCRSS